MSKKKKPDNVVFDEETQRYDAALKPYATNVGAPKIEATDSLAWKKRSIHKVNQKMQTQYLELKAQYDKMMEEFEHNKLLFGAKFAFEPIVGQVYHLYKRENGESFLSLIEPEYCNFDFLGSFYLNAELIWKKVNQDGGTDLLY